MKSKSSDSEQILHQIKPGDLKDYLKNNGWSEESFPREDIIKFRSPHPINLNGKYIDIFIPATYKIVDYDRMVSYAVKSLSAFEKKSSDDIINQIFNFADCLKTRIVEAKKGMVPLEQGVLLYNSLLDLIAYSASSEIEQKSAKKVPRKSDRVMSFARTSLMGQSELGSYVANVYIPLKKPNPDFPWDTTGNVPRRVVLRILRGLENLNDAVIDDTSDPIIENYSTGLNYNMCNALIKIIEAGTGSSIGFSAILEHRIPAPEGISTNFLLKPGAKYYLEKAMDVLKEDDSELEERPFFGYVSLLRRPEELERGLIRLRSIDSENNKTRDIRIELNPSDYQKAVVAHGKKRYIRIKGVLERKGKFWFLTDPNNLEVLEEDSELPWKALKFS